MDINYSNSKIEWTYEGVPKEYHENGIELATNIGNFIYITLYNNGEFSYKYIDFTGQLIVSYKENENSMVVLSKEGKEMTIQIPLLQGLQLDNSLNIYAISGNSYNNKIIKYSKHGDELRTYNAPEGYICYRISDFDNLVEATIVCQGNESTKDNYGRNEWNFVLNFETSKWTLKSLSY